MVIKDLKEQKLPSMNSSLKCCRKKNKRNLHSKKTTFLKEQKEILTALDKGSYFNQELLVNEYETSTIEEHGKSSSQIDLHKETVDESENESDAILESATEEETKNLKQVNQYFVVDFQELQKYLTMVAICSKCNFPLTKYEKKKVKQGLGIKVKFFVKLGLLLQICSRNISTQREKRKVLTSIRLWS